MKIDKRRIMQIKRRLARFDEDSGEVDMDTLWNFYISDVEYLLNKLTALRDGKGTK